MSDVPDITVKIGTVSADWEVDGKKSIAIELKIVNANVSLEDALRWLEEETKFRLVEVDDG